MRHYSFWFLITAVIRGKTDILLFGEVRLHNDCTELPLLDGGN